MPYIERLKAVKEERDLSNNEIAQLSNLPLATVTRIFNGHTANPTFETIAHLAIALGVSLDEIAGLKVPENPMVETTVASYAELLKEKDDRINDLKEEKDRLRKEKQRFALAFAIVVTIILVFVGIDVMHGHFGYLKY